MLRDYRPMDASAEQLVLDYLRRLGDAAQRILHPDERLRFMARSRAAIARQVGETRVAEAGEVLRLLARFGDPQKLVVQERRRLDRAAEPGSRDDNQPGQRRPSASGTGGRPPGAPAPPRKQRPITAPPGRRPFAPPVLHRPITARWRPGDGMAAEPRQRGRLAQDHLTQDRPVRDLAQDLLAQDRTAQHGAAQDRLAQDRLAQDHLTGDRTVSPRRAGPSRPGDGGAESPSGAAVPPGAGPGTYRAYPTGVLALLRRQPLECAAVLLLGVGGLIDPFPLWLLGALAVLVSRLWDARDKLTAVVLPVAVALIGAIVMAGLTARSGSLSGYAHAVRVDGRGLIRAGAVLGAAYLAWRVRRGRRPQREPPWHRSPHE